MPGLETLEVSCARRWRLAGDPVLCRWSQCRASRDIDGDADCRSATSSHWGVRPARLLPLWRCGDVGVLAPADGSGLDEALRDVIGLPPPPLRFDPGDVAYVEYMRSGAWRLARLCLAAVDGAGEIGSYCWDSCLTGARRKYASNSSSSFSIVARRHAMIYSEVTTAECLMTAAVAVVVFARFSQAARNRDSWSRAAPQCNRTSSE